MDTRLPDAGGPLPDSLPDARALADDRSVGALFADLTRDVATLVAQEVNLAVLEFTEGLNRLVTGAVLLIAGAMVAAMGVAVLLAAAVLALALVLPAWEAALIVGIAVALVGVALLLTGRSRFNLAQLKPRRTIETLRADKAWAEEQLP